MSAKIDPLPPAPAIEIVVNGASRHVPDRSSVRSLVAELGLAPERIAVELNRELLPRACLDRELAADDHLEIVTFVGGG